MNNSKHARLHPITLLGAIIWIALILTLYYWVHKPITPALASAVGGAFLDILLAALFVLVAGGVGGWLLHWLDWTTLSAGERLASEALIGLGALSLLILAVGSIWLHAVTMIALLLILAGLTRRNLLGWLRDGREWLRGGLPESGLERFFALAVVILASLALILAVLPPTKWDVLTYHLAGAERYTEHGRFYAVPNNHFLGFPALVDTLYAGGLAITGQLTFGGVLHWAIGLLMLILTGSLTARYAGRAAGWFGAAIVITGATIWQEMTFAYVDLMLMGLVLIGLIALERWNAAREAGNGWLVLIGAVGGLALGTKYTSFPLGAALGLAVLWSSRKDGLRVILQRGAIIAGTAGLVLLPWLVRNAIWYHNPVYPFFFQSADMDSIRQKWYSQPHSGLIYHLRTAWEIPLMPLIATIFGLEGGGTFGADIGPLFLILLPLLGLVWSRISDDQRIALRRLLGIAGIIAVFWIILAAFGSYINVQTRLVLYLFPLLASAAAIILESLRLLPEKPFNLSFIVRVMVVLVIVFTLIDTTRSMLGRGLNLYFSGEEDYRENFLKDQLGWHYEAMSQINDTLPKGANVWFLWEPRSLYCDEARIDCRPDSLMDLWYHARRTVDSGDPAAIAQRWKAQGAQYLLVYEFGRQFEEDNQSLYSDSDWTAWDQFVSGQLVEVWRGANDTDDVQYILYQWQ